MSRCVPIQSNVNTTETFFPGPDASFSTITFPASNQTTQGCINYSTTLSFRDSSAPVRNTFFLQNGLGGYPGTPNDITAMQINSPIGSAAVMVIGAANDGTSYITATNTTGGREPLTITSSRVNMDVLYVSSINGAPAMSASAVSTLEGKVAALMIKVGL